jgi:abortive infection bacteriophage resistance protein
MGFPVMLFATIPAKPLNNAQIGGLLFPGMSCNKPPKTYEEQLALLKNRGLIIDDEPRAIHCLKHHNYYRLSAFRFPLTVMGDPDQFLPGTKFSELWNLYHFDRVLRQLVAEGVKRVEISVRAHWAYVLAHAHGPQAYEHAPVFRNPQRHTDALAKLDAELGRSHEDFVSHYKKKYNMVRPPIWAACEVMSFGLLSRFYENIKRNSNRKQISNTYGLSPEVLESLLQHCAYIRNLCAHHSRLWNRRFTITVQLPKFSPPSLISNFNLIEGRRIYNTLVLLVFVVEIIEPKNQWAKRLFDHINTLNPNLHSHMGFPPDWKDRPIWKNLKA